MLRFFKKSYTEKEKELFRFLRKNPILKDLQNEELDRFLPYIYTRNYHENEVVFFTGDPSHALYIVKRGIISLNIEYKGDFERLMIVRNGSVFGENAILEQTKRVYTAIVHADDTELYVIPKVNLLEIMEHHQEIKAKIMTAFAKLYDGYTGRLFETYKASRGFFDLNTVYS